MKLNPSKCAFRVSAGKFLGFMVSQRGIEANPEKVKDILDMQAPRNIKEVQRLAQMVVALSRFISWAIDKCYPFFSMLKKAFYWDEKCDRAFQKLKDHLGHLPINQPKQGEVLYVYLSISETMVSSVLVREEVGVQVLVYYTRRAFKGAKER